MDGVHSHRSQELGNADDLHEMEGKQGNRIANLRETVVTRAQDKHHRRGFTGIGIYTLNGGAREEKSSERSV